MQSGVREVILITGGPSLYSPAILYAVLVFGSPPPVPYLLRAVPLRNAVFDHPLPVAYSVPYQCVTPYSMPYRGTAPYYGYFG